MNANIATMGAMLGSAVMMTLDVALGYCGYEMGSGYRFNRNRLKPGQ